MELPVVKTKTQYTKYVNILQAELQTATEENSETLLPAQIERLQTRLDALAAKYQDDEELGASRYKLYELQALLYYFQHNDEAALTFIQYAVTAKGESYPKAERLIEKLGQQPERVVELTKAEKRKKLIGIEGWLAWFVVGLIITALVTTYRFFADGFLSSSDIDTYNQYQAGLGDTFQQLTAAENLAIIVYIVLVIISIIFIFRRRKAAKILVIVTLAFGALYGTVDYALGAAFFESANLTQYVQSALDKTAADVGRSVIGAFIWIPYFLVSKRVKATLTK
jgi:hypothetical protein